jgi:hypothetical protein
MEAGCAMFTKSPFHTRSSIYDAIIFYFRKFSLFVVLGIKIVANDSESVSSKRCSKTGHLTSEETPLPVEV